MKIKYVVLAGVLLLIIAAVYFSQQQQDSFIAINQVGYLAEGQKQALLIHPDEEAFELVRASDDSVIYRGEITIKKEPDSATGDAVALIDFSEVTEEGEYYLRIRYDADLQSSKFNISTNIYDKVTNTVLQSYYYHRCGTEVDNGEKWSYQVCHLDDAPFYENPDSSIDVTGGWHDAGDYNKFTNNTALSAALLLYLYELAPSAFTDGQLNIPESNNEIPDLLDEVRWALEWMLKMQRSDGAVYHKVSQKEWTGEYLPHEDPETRYIFEISSSATASVAAVAALGANLFKDVDPEFAEELQKAAQIAWAFLEENPQQIPEGGFQNPPDVSGGEYSNPYDWDVRMWASIELYKLTEEPKYVDYFVQQFQEQGPEQIPAISWRNFESLAYSSFLFADPNTDESEITERIKQLYIEHADSLLMQRDENNYLNLLDESEYYWGSNSVGLAYAYDLIQVFRFTGEQSYRTAALDQLHYILGRNPFNLSQITAMGSRSAQHPYHQLSEMDDVEEPVPGMLVGGPNSYLHLNDEVISPFPGKNYEDRFKNYLVNETAINYTAILAYVVGYFSLPAESDVSDNK